MNMGRTKPLPFKIGIPVVWLQDYYGRIIVQEAVVSKVNTKDGETVVYARYQDRWGNYHSRSFSPIAGMFQEKPWPIWKLIPLNGQNIKALNKRAERANKLFQEYEQRYKEITVDVEQEARQWQRDEIDRRTHELANGPKFLQNVIARMGFKRPKNGVKVRIHKDGEVTIVK